MTYPLGTRCLAEFAGTAVLVSLGTGSIVGGANIGGVPQWVLAVAWFAAVAIPVEAFAFVSGSHINPGVTLGLVARRRFPAREAAPYVVAQLAGAFAGSLLVWRLLGTAAHLGATVPGPGGPAWVLPLEFGFTFLLLASVFYLVGLGRDPTRIELLLPAAVVGLSTWLIGPWTGSSLNIARTLAPALLSGDYAWIGLYAVAVLLAPLAAAFADGRLRKGTPASAPRDASDPTGPADAGPVG